MKCLISIPLQARYHYYPFLQTEVLRGCLLTHPSSHSQGALAFSENPKFCGLSEAASKQAPQLTSRSRSARPPRTGRGCAWRPRSGSTPLRRWFWPRPVGTGQPGHTDPFLFPLSCFVVLGLPLLLGGQISFLMSASAQKPVEVGAAGPAWPLLSPSTFPLHPAFSVADRRGTTFLRRPTLPTPSH